MPAPHGFPPRQLIDRGTLHRILRDRAHQAGVQIHDGKRLIDVDEHPDGVTAQFADGTRASADVLVGADGVHSTVRPRIDPNAPGADYTGLLGFEGLVDDDPNDPATTAIAPATTVFAFGKRAYYLYWKRPDGRIGWGANLPSTEYLSLKQARAIPAGQWLDTLRATYCDDTPGARLAAATTTATFTAVGALHIMPPVAHWHRGRMVLVGGRGARAVQQHRAGCLVGDGKRAAACPLPSRSADRARGIRRLRTAAALAGGEDRRAGRQNQSRQGAGARCQAADALADADHGHGDEHEKTMAAEQRYTVDWDAPVAGDPALA